jgi:putative NADH-flavin reductase
VTAIQNILIIGATGDVGRHLVKQGLERNLSVTAFSRNPAKAGFPNTVKSAAGDATDPTALAKALEGQQAAIFVAGTKPGATTFFSDATRVLIPAMEKAGVHRLIAITGVGAGETKGHGGFLYDRIVYPFITKKIYEDKDRQEALIKASSLDWTIVRPAAFMKKTPPGKPQVVTDVGNTTFRRIKTEHVAAFILDELANGAYIRKTPFIGFP